MTFTRLTFQPGIYTEGTRIDSANRFVDGDHTRFFENYPKKVGGCTKNSPNQFLGYCRGMDAWVTLDNVKYIALGTNLKLYIDDGGMFVDITPIRESGTLGADPITTVISTASVTIADAGHGLSVGDFVTLTGATAVGGLTISGQYTVTTVPNSSTYTITSPIAATSSTTGGGAAVAYAYQIPVGSQNTYALMGWGAGTWGSGTWGTPRSGNFLYARTWVVSNYGEDLVASPRGGAIYRWIASTGTSVRAVVVVAAPETNLFVIVSSEDRYTISFGAHDGVDSDPMLIRWSSQNDINDWTPTSTNTAGDKRLSEGSLIITACSTRGSIVISTDTNVYQMYPDSEFVFGFKDLGNGACISPNGMTQYRGVVYWMGNQNFYFYDGTIHIINCDVRSYVFDNIDEQQFYKVYAFVNSDWNEIWWVYQDVDGTECNRYVAYDYVQKIWHIGSWDRTAGMDRSVVSNNVIMAGANQFLYDHESGVDNDGSPLEAFYTTGSPQDHNRYSYIKKFIPNFLTLVGTMQLVFETQTYPQDPTPVTSASFNVTSATPYICPRLRGDEFRVTSTSNQLGGDFWGGTNQVEVIAVGSR